MKKQPVANNKLPQTLINSKPNYWTIAIIALVVIIFIGGVYTLFLKSQKDKLSIPASQPTPSLSSVSPTTTSQLSSTPDPTVNWKTYRNDRYGFEVGYPTEAILKKGQSSRIDLPFDPGTLLSEKYLAIITKPENAQECLMYLPSDTIHVQTTKMFSLNNIEFKKQTASEGASGNVYETVSYSTTKGNRCVGLQFTLHSADPGIFGGNPPANFDREKEREIFDQILSTFKFTDQEGQKKNQVVCAQDVKRCSDGSYVSRQPPSCAFSPCSSK